MGGKSSKADGGLMRGGSFRRSQKVTLQKIERKLNKTSKDIDNFKGTIDDNKYTKIKQNITEIINDLEKINAAVKDKYKESYQGMLDRCNEELQKLDGKVTSSPSLSPAASPTPISPANLAAKLTNSPLNERSTNSVQVKLVKIVVDADTPKPDKPKVKKEVTIKEDIQTEIDLEHETVDKIDTMRKKIEYLETEIHIYKSEPDEKLYGFIRENLNQIIIKLDTLETFGNIQIKHERKLALQRAQECLKYLNDGTGKTQELEEDLEEHQPRRSDKERLSNRSTYRPITLDVNISEKLNEELQSVIHKRLEEAAKDIQSDKNGEKQRKLEKSAKSSTDESFENFENPDSEDEFDFVNVDSTEKDGTPVLVTSF